jgi:hypothetical protein
MLQLLHSVGEFSTTRFNCPDVRYRYTGMEQDGQIADRLGPAEIYDLDLVRRLGRYASVIEVDPLIG